MVLIGLGNKGFLVYLTVGGVTVLCLLATLSTAKYWFNQQRLAQLTWAIDICWLSSVSTAELLVSLIQQSWIFQTDRIPSTHWALDICRLSSASVAELLVSSLQQAWIF